MSSLSPKLLHEQADLGYSAVAEAFRLGGDELARVRARMPFPYLHLVVNYLYRHAAELYLKSTIVLIHRSRRFPYGTHSHGGAPFALVDDHWRELHQIHRLSDLFTYVSNLTSRSRKVAKVIAATSWPAERDAVRIWAQELDRGDASSTLFRYPFTQHVDFDRAKSSWRRTSLDALLRDQFVRGQRGVMAAVGPRGTYRLVRDPMKRLSQKTKKATRSLASLNATVWSLVTART